MQFGVGLMPNDGAQERLTCHPTGTLRNRSQHGDRATIDGDCDLFARRNAVEQGAGLVTKFP